MVPFDFGPPQMIECINFCPPPYQIKGYQEDLRDQIINEKEIYSGVT